MDRAEMQTFGLAALAAVSSIAIIATAVRRHGDKGQGDKKSSPPPQYSPGLPIVGGFMKFASDPLGTIRAGRQQCGDVFTLRMLTEQLTVLIGPAPHAAFFNSTDEEADQADVYKFMTPIFGNGVVYDCPIEKRRQQMRALGAALKPGNLRLYPEIIAQETKRYFDSRWGEEGTADIHQTFADLIIQTGSATLMGPEIRNELFDEMYRLYQDLDKGLTPLSVFFPYAPTAAHARRDAARKSIGQLFTKIIHKRREDPEASKANQDIVQRLMDFTYSDGSKFTEDEIAGMMVATLFAAQHTSNVTATWTILFLLEDARKGGNYLKRAIEEMRKVEPEPNAFRDGRGIDHKVLADQPWLYACVKEAIRMHPPIIFLLRRALVDIPINAEMHVPKGNIFMVSNAIAQRLPEVFERPDEYLPDRWATWDISTLPKYSFIGFGAGIHTCMGESFAFLQVRTILNVLLSTFEFELTTEFPTPDYESIVVMPHGPNIVHYRRKARDASSGVPRSVPAVAQQKAAAPQLDFKEVDPTTKLFTRAEVALHNKRDDLWLIVRGKVYDISSYVHLHQGGEAALLRVAGGEATEQVEGPQHPGTVPTLLQRFLIGSVVD